MQGLGQRQRQSQPRGLEVEAFAEMRPAWTELEREVMEGPS